MTMMRCGVLMLSLGLIGHGASQAAKTATKMAPKTKVSVQTRPRVTPFVTRDNFVSLSQITSGGFTNLTTSVLIQGHTISRSGPVRGGSFCPGGSGPGSFGSGAEPYRPPATAGLSNKQMDALLRALNEAKFPTLVGKYRQKNLADGINETLILTISDDKDRDRSFVIENYGDLAPPAYFKLTTFLNNFVAMKLPIQPAASSGAASQ